MRLSDVLTRSAAAIRRLGGRIRSAIGAVARMAARVVRGAAGAVRAASPVQARWTGVAAVLWTACGKTHDRPAPPPPPVEEVAQPAPPPVDAAIDAGDRPLGDFQLTFYYVAREEEVDGPARVAHVSIDAGVARTPTPSRSGRPAKDDAAAPDGDHADRAAAAADRAAADDDRAAADDDRAAADDDRAAADRDDRAAPPDGDSTAATPDDDAAAGAADRDAITAAPDRAAAADRGDDDDRDDRDHDDGDHDDDRVMAAALPDLVPIYARDCSLLVNVSREFAAQMTMQGTGRLRDGRVLNVAGPCSCPRVPCFHVLPPHRKWGMGGGGQPLEPFRTVAVDPKKIKLGTLLYVEELDGLRMPGPPPIGGFVHDGCVVAGDTGGGVQGAQLDLFVARRAYYRGLARRGRSHRWAKRVHVFDGTHRCQRRDGKVSRSAAGST